MTENHEINRTGDEIAIIGMAGRFPGARNIDEFWNNLINGIESITFITDEELNESGIDLEMVKNPNYVKTRGGVLEDKECFDAAFFDYTVMDARIMDPQTRIFHECTYEALENAGYVVDTYDGIIGLYAGASSSSTWEALVHFSGMTEEIGGFFANQLAGRDFLCTRVAYKFDLKGPAINIQTTCSTSLVAVHMACQAILNGECDMALAGGVSINPMKKNGYIYQEGMIFSPDGHCRAFDAGARGTVGGNGIGIVVLKSLKTALEEGDYIHAIIRGTAVNNDGINKAGYTAPSVNGQVAVIQATLQLAAVESETITYIETHGTGTPLGDPIEIEALKQAFNTKKKNFCAIGSVKTNIGHLDAAAGVAGLIKTVMALKNKLIPPSLHYQNPNPKIDFKNSPFFVNAILREWTREDEPLRAGVSSFGIGGTNAHVILEESPRLEDTDGGREWQILLFSAKTGAALEQITQNFTEYLRKNPAIHLPDAAYTLQVGRKIFKHRKMLVCSDVDVAIESLSNPDSRKVKTFFSTDETKRVVFMFAGLGSQYIDMGREFYKSERVFRWEMDRCFDILNTLVDFDIKEILYPRTSQAPGHSTDAYGIHHPEIAQIAIFIFEYALAKMLMSWGVDPLAMIGYSSGEYVAACLAGVFSLEDVLELIVYRGKSVKQLPTGIMLSVPIAKEELPNLINDFVHNTTNIEKNISNHPTISVAIDNGLSCVVAGSDQAIEAFEIYLKGRGYMSLRIQNSHAFHSPMMEPILEQFARKVSGFVLNKPRIPFISNVTGDWISDEDCTDPAYWAAHLGKTVCFSEGIKKLLGEENSIFIEIGPASDLSTLVSRYIDKDGKHHVLNLVRPSNKNVSDIYFLLNQIGRLWLYGKNIDWLQYYEGEKRRRISIPTYPFQRDRFWIEGDLLKRGVRKPLEISLGQKKEDTADWFYIPQWKRALRPQRNDSDNNATLRWLLFISNQTLDLELIKQLKAAGEDVLTVFRGQKFFKTTDSEYTVNPAFSDDYKKLFDELNRLGKLPHKIVHLWTTGGDHRKEIDVQWVEKTLDIGFFSLIYIVKAIGKLHFSHNIQIEIVTTDVQEVTGTEILCPEKASILGPAKVIPQEYPYLICRCLDIELPEPGSSREKQLIDWLLEEFKANSQDTVIAYRGNHRWVQFYDPIRIEKKVGDIPKLRKNGVFLITGGLGKIGATLSEYLAKTVQAKLILTGRTPMPSRDKWEQWLNLHNEEDGVSRKIREVLKLEELGGEVLPYEVDVADEKKMEEVIAQAEKSFGLIHGVIYAAGDTGESIVSPIENISQSSCRMQFHPKIYGVLALQKVLKNKKLDFCLLTSSLSPILGGLGFSAYSAANNFLDAFVHKMNRENHTHWISVNWGDWNFKKEPSRLAMTPEEGVETFKAILNYFKATQLVVSSWDLQARIDKWVKLESVREEPLSGKRTSPSVIRRPDLLNPYRQPTTQVEKQLADLWGKLFGFQLVGIDDDFFELGGDSLKAIILTTRIHKEFDVKVPLTEIFKTPTIKGLSEYIKDVQNIGNEKKSEYITLCTAEKKEFYLSSFTQKRFYILQHLNPEITSYNLPSIFVIEGYLEKNKLEKVFMQLIKRHDSLRTSFELIDGQLVQRIHGQVEIAIELYEDLQEKEKKIIQNFVRPFTLNKAPLLRVGLIKVGENRYILMIDMHHIITDGLSSVIISRDFIELYEGKALSELPFQYTDFSEWQHSEKEKERLKKQGEFWLNQFKNEVPILKLRTDYPRPAVQSFEGRTINFEITAMETEALNHIMLQEGTSLFMVLFAIYNILLRKLTNQVNIIIGTGVLSRNHADLMNIVGLFFNTIPLQNYIEEELTFNNFLNYISEKTLAAFENQEYPLDMLVENLLNSGLLARDPSRNPLFDTMFALQNFGAGTSETTGSGLTGITIKPYVLEKQTSRFDLFLEGTPSHGSIRMRLEYSTALFKHSTAQKITGYYMEILKQVLENKEIKLKEISISNNLLDVKAIVDQKEYMDFGF